MSPLSHFSFLPCCFMFFISRIVHKAEYCNTAETINIEFFFYVTSSYFFIIIIFLHASVMMLGVVVIVVVVVF